eukprot:1160803-Pelagomonas_calceolata.AAC.8
MQPGCGDMGAASPSSCQAGRQALHLRLHDSQQATTAKRQQRGSRQGLAAAGFRLPRVTQVVHLQASPFSKSSLTRDGEMEKGDE